MRRGQVDRTTKQFLDKTAPFQMNLYECSTNTGIIFLYASNHHLHQFLGTRKTQGLAIKGLDNARTAMQ